MFSNEEAFLGVDLRGDQRSFRAVRYVFDHKADSRLLSSIADRGSELAGRVNQAQADSTSIYRDPERLENICISGILSKFCWKSYLNRRAGFGFAMEPAPSGAMEQIDLVTVGGRSIEVRSSFPRSGIKFALFNHPHQFDVLGPGSSSVKPGEACKDFYVRALYPFASSAFWSHFTSRLEVYLTGGATWNMMADTAFFKEKDLQPEDDVFSCGEKSCYRVVPLSLALDTPDIADHIISCT